MILFTGAGGKTGKALIRTLSTVESVCAFVYHDEHVSFAKDLGAEKIIIGDMRDEAAIASAMLDVRAVYHICSNMNPDEIVIGDLMIRMAKKSGVEHFVYQSVLHPQTEKMTHHWQKLRVEEMIFESGVPFTILQPAPYMQNLLAGWKSIVEDGILRVPYSVYSKFSSLDLGDLAEAAKVVLTGPNHNSAIYELAGTLPMSHVDVAEVCSHVLNRDVRAEKEEIGNWKLRAERNPALSKYALENLIRMFKYYDQWGLTANPNVLSWLLQREPPSLETFFRKEHDEWTGLRL